MSKYNLTIGASCPRHGDIELVSYSIEVKNKKTAEKWAKKVFDETVWYSVEAD